MTAVDKQINGREAGCQERAPPPLIVLRAQVEVAQQHSSLWNATILLLIQLSKFNVIAKKQNSPEHVMTKMRKTRNRKPNM